MAWRGVSNSQLTCVGYPIHMTCVYIWPQGSPCTLGWALPTGTHSNMAPNFTCNICQIGFDDPDIFFKHLQTAEHANNLVKHNERLARKRRGMLKLGVCVYVSVL